MNIPKIFEKRNRFKKIYQKRGRTGSEVAMFEYKDFAMNTEITFKIFGENAPEACNDAIVEIKRLEKKLSRFIPDSEISRLNQEAGKSPVKISPETCNLLSRAICYSKASKGTFNILTGALMDLWDYKHAADAPEKTKILQISPFIDYRDLILDEHDQTAMLRKSGQSIDLGGIGKGFAADFCMDIFKKRGITSAFVNIGGNVSVLGNKPDGSPWCVGIRHPRRENELLAAVKITGKTVVTSGDYERYFVDHEGKKWHHIMNPATGFPAESDIISVTIIADNSTMADALSTAVFVAGIDEGLMCLSKFPGTEAVLVDKHEQVFITCGLEKYFQCAENIKVNVIERK